RPPTPSSASTGMSVAAARRNRWSPAPNTASSSAARRPRRSPSTATTMTTRISPPDASSTPTAASPRPATPKTGITTRRTMRERTMLDDFFTRAVIGGVGLALTTGPLGCFIVWRRMAYFGDTMAHSALLGVALAFLFEINLTVGVFVVAMLASLALLALQRRGALSTDALLGILSHSTLALGLVMIAFMTWVRVDLMGFLFGDILAVSRLDI